MYSIFLGEAYYHGPCLAMLHFSIHTMFDLEHPFAKKQVSYPWEVTPTFRCCWQQINCIVLA
jgi:hypothetical protein